VACCFPPLPAGVVVALVTLLMPLRSAVADDRGAHVPSELTPPVAADALARHLQVEVLPYLTDPARDAATPQWADTYGMPIVRLLRRLYVYAIAIERQDDAVRRETIRDQYDALFKRLVDGFHDRADGLWVVSTDYVGHTVLDGTKSLISQVYVIYVMAEVAGLLGDAHAKQIALETFEALDAVAHDNEYGGYVECPGLPLGAPANATKSLGSNMHLALGLARLYSVAPSEKLRLRLEELLDVLTRRVRLKKTGNAALAYTRQWRAVRSGTNLRQQTLYGHNAELGWYAFEAARALNQSPADMLPWMRRVAEGLMRNAVGQDGEVYVWGPWVGPPENRAALRWWPQTEAMILLSRMYRLTGEARYWDAFEKVVRFTFEHFVPDHSGAWLSDVNLRDGSTADGSDDPWFAGLHVVRCLLECEAALRAAG